MNHGENVNITLVTYPYKDKAQFPEKIDKLYDNYKSSYNSYKKKNNNPSKSKNDEHLFSPLKYHLFSNYDLAVISITDSEKFAQKVFAPDSGDTGTNRSTYQIITGITKQIYDHSNFDLGDTLKNLTKTNSDISKPREGKYKYALFVNICVNKGLLIGLGAKLIDELCKVIDKKIRTRLKLKKDKSQVTNRYLLSTSYSWFDLSIVLFGDKPQDLINALLDIRNIKLAEVLSNNSLDINRSLYKLLYLEEINDDKLKNIHIITETSSILGVEYYKFERGQEFKNDELITSTEWKIKSGYERQFCDLIKKVEFGKYCDDQNFYFENGKMDFIFEERERKSIKSNLVVFNTLRQNPGISQFVKKVKTKTLFNNVNWQNELASIDTSNDISDIAEKLEKVTFSKQEILEIKTKLRTDKISRQLRNKIIKCFYLTNIGLTDRVLFNFYLDFIPFLKRLYYLILTEEPKFKSLRDYEDVLLQYIIAYDRAYKNRTFNSYLFEDIHEYSIDYNASLQQLLSNYNSCIHILTRSYNTEKKTDTTQSPRLLVNINLNNTVSNPVSINFHVHDLTAPELIFCLLHKEIINEYIKCGAITSPIDLPQFYKTNFSFVNTNDIFNDCFRMILTFNFDFELYSFWFWSFNIQNTQIYDKNGFINESHFAHELIRYLSVKLIFENNIEDKCPVPEIYFYWERYYNGFYDDLKIIFNELKVKEIQNDINKCIEIFIDKYRPFEFLKIKLSEKWNLNLEGFDGNFIKSEYWLHRYEWLKVAEKFTSSNNLNLLYLVIKEESFKGDKYNRQKHSIILDTMIYCFLKKMQQKQNKQISILRRNLISGEPMISFINELEYDSFYCLDPQGGHFNIDSDKNAEYFELRNEMMTIIWDLALEWKKDYISEKIEDKSTKQDDK